MKIWDEILRTSILGAERSGLGAERSGVERRPGVFSPVEGRLGELLDGLTADAAPERMLLDRIAAVGLYLRAGKAPATDRSPLTDPASAEDLPLCGRAAAERLKSILATKQWPLLDEWLAAASVAGRRVPEQLLPTLLELGRTQASLRPALLCVTGRRGVWLAMQNEDWNYATGHGERDWEEVWSTEGSAARRTLLSQIRALDPARARALVLTTWNEDKPEDRAAFVSAFQVGLSQDDEPFLESALDDRRKEVRRASSELLARLPGSALSGRMIERVGKLLDWRDGWRSRISVTLPDACDKAMMRDGIELKPVNTDRGERAWWLEQMLAAIAPRVWSERWRCQAADLVKAAGRSEWAEVLLGGWEKAAARHSDAPWIEALIAGRIARGDTANLHPLFSALPDERREAILIERLRADASLNQDRHSFWMLAACRFAWSERLSEEVLGVLSAHASRGKYEPVWYWPTLLDAIGVFFNPALTDQAVRRLERRGGDNLEPGIAKFLETLQFRSEMHKEIVA